MPDVHHRMHDKPAYEETKWGNIIVMILIVVFKYIYPPDTCRYEVNMGRFNF